MIPNPLYQLLQEVFTKNGHTMPTGKPLYAYRCTDRQYKSIEDSLTKLGKFMSYGKKAPIYVHEAFCLYAAEWVRRNHTTGHVRWTDITSSLQWPQISNSSLTYLTEKGLTFWQRPLRVKGNNPAYLLTLILEGGLPLKMMINNKGTLVDYFKKVLSGVRKNTNSQLCAADIAEQLEDYLPSSLRNDVVFTLAGEICEKLNFFAKNAEAYHNDIVDKIRLSSPLWYTQLPVVLSEKDAEELAKAVFSIDEKSTSYRTTLKIQRDWIKDDEECWHCEAKFKLPLSLKHGALLQNFSISEPIEATRLLLRGVSHDFTLDLALLSRNNDETWAVEKYPDSNKLIMGSAALKEIRFDLFDGNNLVGTNVPAGGVSLPDDLPWVLDPLDNNTNTLRVIGAGSLSTTSPLVYIAMPLKNCFVTLDSDGELGIPEIIHECERFLLPVKGDYVVTLEDGLHCTVRTNQEYEDAPYFLWGRTAFKNITCKYPIFCGEPIIYQVNGPDYSLLDSANLYWRKLKAGGLTTWHKFSELSPLGKVEIRQMINGEVIHSSRCVILPTDAHLSLVPISDNGGAIKFTGFGDVHIEDLNSGEYADLSVTKIDNEMQLVANSKQECHQPLKIKLCWLGYESVELYIPFPAKGCRFTGSCFFNSDDFIGVNQLYGVRAEGIHTEGDEGKFWLELEQENSKLLSPVTKNNLLKIKYLMQSQDTTSKVFLLNAIQAPLKGLLSNLSQDGVVMLRAYSAGCKENKLSISFYPEPIYLNGTDVFLRNKVEQSRSSVDFFTIQLTDLDKEPECLPSNKTGCNIAPLLLNGGIWLLYGKRDDLIVTNQIVIHASDNKDNICPLVNMSFWDDKAADEYLSVLEGSFTSIEWFNLLDILQRLRDFHPCNFPILVKLAQKENLLLALLFNAMFKGMHEQVWQLENQLGFCWGSIPLVNWEETFSLFASDSQEKMNMPTPMLLMMDVQIRSLAIRDWRSRKGFDLVLNKLSNLSGKELIGIEMATNEQATKAIQDLTRLVDGLSRLEGYPKEVYLSAFKSHKALHDAVNLYWLKDKYSKDIESPVNHTMVWAALTLLGSKEAESFKLLQPLLNLAYLQAPEHFGPLFNYFQNNLVK